MTEAHTRVGLMGTHVLQGAGGACWVGLLGGSCWENIFSRELVAHTKKETLAHTKDEVAHTGGAHKRGRRWQGAVGTNETRKASKVLAGCIFLVERNQHVLVCVWCVFSRM